MIGLDVAIIAEGSNHLIGRGKVVSSFGDVVAVRMSANFKVTSDKVCLLTYKFNRSTGVYLGTIASITADTVVVSDIVLLANYERRRAIRYEVDLPALVVLQKREIDFEVNTIDISRTGLLIESPTELDLDQRLSIQIPLEYKDGRFQVFNSEAKIVRLVGKNRYGCELAAMTDTNTYLLQDYIIHRVS